MLEVQQRVEMIIIISLKHDQPIIQSHRPMTEIIKLISRQPILNWKQSLQRTRVFYVFIVYYTSLNIVQHYDTKLS